MKLLDANLLLYAYTPSLPQHKKARAWLEKTLSTAEPVWLCWATILAFLRISTHRRAFEQPLSIGQAARLVAQWLDQPPVSIVGPGDRHWEILQKLLPASQSHGPLVSDAHLAALAIELGAVLCTNDRDFGRFPGLRFENPLED